MTLLTLISRLSHFKFYVLFEKFPKRTRCSYPLNVCHHQRRVNANSILAYLKERKKKKNTDRELRHKEVLLGLHGE